MPDESQNRVKDIIVVDDNEQNLMILEEMLESSNYTVRCFSKGDEAIFDAERKAPDLFLLDVCMPVISGFEVCRIINRRENLKNIPVIFLSALTSPEDKVEGFRVGGVDFITKPFSLEEVETRVKTHIKIKELQNELKNKNKTLEKIVDERTYELQEAYKKLKMIDKIKSEFLQIMAHEIRTPFNGLVGSMEMMLGICPGTCKYNEDVEFVRSVYIEARENVIRLMEDAALMAEVENIGMDISKSAIELNWMIEDICKEINGNFIISNETKHSKIISNCEFITYALKMAFKTALCFSLQNTEIECRISDDEDKLNILFKLNNVQISQEQCNTIFEITSKVRGESQLVKLGMSPVVAAKVFNIFCGEMSLKKYDDVKGELKITLNREGKLRFS